MNPVVKELWLDALKSDKYPKGSGQLNFNNEEYCCLGVLCEVALEQGILSPDNKQQRASGVITYANAAQYLPNKVSEWAALPDDAPYRLATINDNSATFDRVTRTIEEQL